MSVRFGSHGSLIAALFLLLACSVVAYAQPLTGEIFTTRCPAPGQTFTGKHIAVFPNLNSVGLYGGPTHTGAPGIPKGSYFVVVTDAYGTILAKSNTKVVTVGTNGKFAQCYKLKDLVYMYSNPTQPGCDECPNGANIYKVFLCTNATFPCAGPQCLSTTFQITPPLDSSGIDKGTLNIVKFYDTNADGYNDEVIDCELDGWKVNIQDCHGFSIDVFTEVELTLAPGFYVVSEYLPLEQNWKPTGAWISNEYTTKSPTPTVAVVEVKDGCITEVEFGNVCLGAGGAHFPCSWCSYDASRYICANDLAILRGMNLRNANGTCFDPTSVSQFCTWLNQAQYANNMAYLLSAYLASLKLDVLKGYVDVNALVYAPGTSSANEAGYATIGDLICEVNTELGKHGVVCPGSPFYAYQQLLRDILFQVTSNLNFVQTQFCCAKPGCTCSTKPCLKCKFAPCKCKFTFSNNTTLPCQQPPDVPPTGPCDPPCDDPNCPYCAG